MEQKQKNDIINQEEGGEKPPPAASIIPPPTTATSNISQKNERASILKKTSKQLPSDQTTTESVTAVPVTDKTRTTNKTKHGGLHVHVPQMSKKNIADKKIIGLKDAGILTRQLSDRRKKFLDASAPPAIARSNASVGSGTTLDNVEDKEKAVRSKQLKNPLVLLFLGNLAALKVMAIFLISLETIITCGVTVGLTCYWYNYGLEHEDWNGGGMDYIILAFALTSPVATAISMAFARREAALANIADFRSFAHHLYAAHCLWDWPEKDGSSGRANVTKLNLREHCDGVMAQLVGIGDELSRFLTLPATSRSRHRMTRQGRREAARTIEVAYQLLESMTTQRMTLLSIYAERLKMVGLNSGELSRMRQYERFIESFIEKLRMTKMYRTPQGLRSFARIFTLLLPPFYAPTYAQTGLEVHSLGVGIAFGLLTAIGLTALFESLQVLEDPFTAYLALDGIDVREEFEVLLWTSLVNTRKLVFPDAPPYPVSRRAALVSSNSDKNLGSLASPSTHHIQIKRPPSIPEIDDDDDDAKEKTPEPDSPHLGSGSPIDLAEVLADLTSHSDSIPQETAEFGTPLEEDFLLGESNPVRESGFTSDAGASILSKRHRRDRSGSIVGLWTSE